MHQEVYNYNYIHSHKINLFHSSTLHILFPRLFLHALSSRLYHENRGRLFIFSFIIRAIFTASHIKRPQRASTRFIARYIKYLRPYTPPSTSTHLLTLNVLLTTIRFIASSTTFPCHVRYTRMKLELQVKDHPFSIFNPKNPFSSSQPPLNYSPHLEN